MTSSSYKRDTPFFKVERVLDRWVWCSVICTWLPDSPGSRGIPLLKKESAPHSINSEMMEGLGMPGAGAGERPGWLGGYGSLRALSSPRPFSQAFALHLHGCSCMELLTPVNQNVTAAPQRWATINLGRRVHTADRLGGWQVQPPVGPIASNVVFERGSL